MACTSSSISYNTSSLFSLRSQAVQPRSVKPAEDLNLWLATAQRNRRGQTQPFPFNQYTRGIGSIIKKNITHIFDNNNNMSDWNTQPVADTWGAPEEFSTFTAELTSTAEPTFTTEPAMADGAHNIDANPPKDDEPTSSKDDEPTSSKDDEPISSPASEAPKTSLADLTNGDRTAATKHLATGLGPHKLLARFSPTDDKFVGSTALSDPDGAASVVDDPASVVDGPASNTSVDGSTSHVDSAAALSATDESAASKHHTPPDSATTTEPKPTIHSPMLSRKPGPHRKLVLAQQIPLPKSPALLPDTVVSNPDEITLSPQSDTVIIGRSLVPVVTISDDSDSDQDSDTASAVIKIEPLDPKANSWTPEVSVEPLPPSRPESPTAPATQHILSNAEADHINQCCPVPKEWTVPTVIGSFAGGDVFRGTFLGDIHKPALAFYSQYFSTALEKSEGASDSELGHLVDDPAFTVFREWVYGRELSVKSATDGEQIGSNIHLKTLVQIWRFGARIQAPLFANTVASAIINKTISASDIFAAADEIDAVLMLVDSSNVFRLLIAHSIITNRIRIKQEDYEKWPKSLIWCVATWLSKDNNTYLSTQVYPKAYPCAYHLHPSGRTCLN